ncbi:MAG: retropepsin-like domain-containing protein [Flavobacteriales bacterium]|nr:retropepsin-like domain-containing protein [Flavobacteriales bacterium]
MGIKRHFLLFIVSSLFLNACSFKRIRFIPATAEPVESKFETYSELIFIEVEVNGVGGTFLFDNGFTESGINASFAKRAHVTFKGKTSTRDANNRSASTPTAVVDLVEIEGQKFVNAGFYRIDTDRFFPCKKIDGVIGASIINMANWKINFEAKNMWISSKTFEGKGIPLDISFSNNNSSFTTISVLGQPYSCKIDLGNANTVKLDPKYAEKSLEGIVAEKRIGIMSLSAHGLGNVDSTYQIKELLEIQHRGKTLPVKEKVLFRGKLKYQGYLGINYFKPYDLIINSTEKRYWLSKRTKIPNPKSDSSYGVVLYPLEDKWKVIQLNSKDSLIKGIKLMDEVSIVDSIPMGQFKGICEYKEFLRAKMKNKEVLKLTLKDGNHAYTIPLHQIESQKLTIRKTD